MSIHTVKTESPVSNVFVNFKVVQIENDSRITDGHLDG